MSDRRQWTMDRFKRFLRGYARGSYTCGEIVARVHETATPDCASELVRILPPEILSSLRDHVNRMPTTDEDWSRLKLFNVGGSNGNGNNPSEPETPELSQAERVSNHRVAVEALRSALMQW